MPFFFVKHHFHIANCAWTVLVRYWQAGTQVLIIRVDGDHIEEEGTKMMLRVQYRNEHYDYVDTHNLDRLLVEGNTLRKFFGASERRWVNIYHDPIRGVSGYHIG